MKVMNKLKRMIQATSAVHRVDVQSGIFRRITTTLVSEPEEDTRQIRHWTTICDNSLDGYDTTKHAVLVTFIGHVRSKVCAASEKRCRDHFMILRRLFQRPVDAQQTQFLHKS